MYLFIATVVLFWLAYQSTQYFGAIMGFGSHSQQNGPAITFTALGFLCFFAGIWLFSSTALFISTADSRSTILVDKSYQFMREVMERIREALVAGEDGQIVYQVNVHAEKIERLDANSTTVTNSAGAIIAGGNMGDERATSGGIADLINRAREHVAPLAEQASQTASELARRGRSLAEDQVAALRQQAARQRTTGTSANHFSVNNAPGAIVAGGGMSFVGSQVSTHGSIVNDFDTLMTALASQNLTHKNEILDYLRPVRDHLAGGVTPREDAVSRWLWFAGNVASTLSGVDGVLALVDRIGRLLGVGR
jgi:hypothetical protein